MKKLSVLTILILVSLSSAALANVPQKFNFQGQLLDSAGKPVNGAISMTFGIYDDAASTEPANLLWTEVQTVTVTDGVYNVLLGQVEPLDTELSDTTALWLGVTVSGDTEMTPRVELTPGVYDLIMMNTITVKDGNVGIGTTNPTTKIHIKGDSAKDTILWLQSGEWNSTGDYTELRLGDINHYIRGEHTNGMTFYDVNKFQFVGGPVRWGNAYLDYNYPYNEIKWGDNTGWYLSFVRRSDGKHLIDIKDTGETTIHGTLHVTGGADIPEVFEMSDVKSLELGDVVSIDPQNPKHLTKSLTAYDHKVAGIVSNAEQAASIIGVREDGSSDKPVALAGRVLCKVSTENGAIKIGDLLTTSSTPGYAMKATEKEQMQGALLGKALEAFDGEAGMIMVLVALQ